MSISAFGRMVKAKLLTLSEKTPVTFKESVKIMLEEPITTFLLSEYKRILQ